MQITIQMLILISLQDQQLIRTGSIGELAITSYNVCTGLIYCVGVEAGAERGSLWWNLSQDLPARYCQQRVWSGKHGAGLKTCVAWPFLKYLHQVELVDWSTCDLKF